MPDKKQSSANILIQAMDADDYGALSPYVGRVDLKRGAILNEQGDTPEFLYFPEGGVLSILSGLDEAISSEIGLCGREGMSDIGYVFGASQTPFRTMVQINGHDAVRIAAAPFIARFDESASLRSLVLKYAHTLAVQMSQALVSALHHHLESRLARWLLMCSDRVGGHEMQLTHEFMSNMLGVQRSSVTVTLHVLEGFGAIRSTRGLVTVRDRSKLEDLAGDTYGFAEAEYCRLIAPFGAGSLQWPQRTASNSNQ